LKNLKAWKCFLVFHLTVKYFIILGEGEENFSPKTTRFFSKSGKTARSGTIVHHREQNNLPRNNLDLLIEVNFKC